MILFNHESQGEETFVTRKIITALCKINLIKEPLILGNLYSKRDWGRKRLCLCNGNITTKPDDFVISTGNSIP